MFRHTNRHLKQLVTFKSLSIRRICVFPTLRKAAAEKSSEKHSERVLAKVEMAEKVASQKIEFTLIKIEKHGNITKIGINRPEVRNAINADAAGQLCAAFDAFEQDTTSYVAVLYGIGGSFCAGYDLHELGSKEKNYNVEMLLQAEGAVGPTRRHIQKPVVCAISGHCLSNGLELALMCDLRVMEDSAILCFSNRKLGIPLIDGGTARLTAIVGFSRALDLILTGREVMAQEAYKIGIANRVVPTGTSLKEAVDLASAMSAFPQASIIHDRKSVYGATFETQNFDETVQNEVMYTSNNVLKQMTAGIKQFNEGKFKIPSLKTLRRNAIPPWERCELDIEEKIKEGRKHHGPRSTTKKK